MGRLESECFCLAVFAGTSFNLFKALLCVRACMRNLYYTASRLACVFVTFVYLSTPEKLFIEYFPSTVWDMRRNARW